MVIFHSYVKLPEGTICSVQWWISSGRSVNSTRREFFKVILDRSPEGLHLLTALPPPPYASTNGRDASYPQLKISCHISSHGKLGYPIKSTQKRTDSVLLSILKDSVLQCTTSYYIPPLVATNGRCIYQTSVYLCTVNTLLWYSRTLTYLHLGGSERCHLHITQMV